MVVDGQYKKIVCGYTHKEDNSTLYITVKDIHHLDRIYKKYNITPESIDCVRVEFILQRHMLSRYVIKELDLLLRVGGCFEIVIMDSKAHSSYTRSRDQVKYEMSISTNGRYKQTIVEKLLDNKVLKFSYIKQSHTLLENDSIEKWSFGIVTNGKNPAKVERLIASIRQQNIPKYEILVCGSFINHNQYSEVVVLDDVAITDELRAPLCVKKNKIICLAKYNNLCILHERFHLPHSWYNQIKQYGNFFDFLCLPTLDDDGQRFEVDWMQFCEPLTKTATKNKSMQYSKWTPSMIIQGGVILGKKNIMSQYMLDERLFWEELEDIHFSKVAYLNGAFINTDVNNYFISDAVNHKAAIRNISLYKIFREKLSWPVEFCKNFLKFKYYIKFYIAE